MRNRLWLSVLACVVAAPSACTFGADDFKVVASSEGGDSGNGGGNSGGTSNGNGNGGVAELGGAATSAGQPNDGGADSGAVAGAGGAGDVANGGAGGQDTTVTFACSTRSQKLTLFSDMDLGNAPVDEFAMVNGGPLAGYAVATTDSQQTDATLLVRRVTDSMNTPVSELIKYRTQGHFKFGTAYLAASVLHVVGADQRGIIDVAFLLGTRGELPMMGSLPTVTTLQTPIECTTSGMGSVRDLKAVWDERSLTYAVTCQGSIETMLSLHLRTDDAALHRLGDTSAMPPPELSSLVIRQYAHSSDGTALLITGSDGPGTIYARFGKTDPELRNVFPIGLGAADKTLFQMATIFPLADHGGVYLFDTSLHDPSSGSVVPVTTYGGVFKTVDYPSFRQAPPPQLVELAVYTKSDAVVLPSDAVVRIGGDVVIVGNDPLANSSIYAWMLDLKGRAISPRMTVFAPAGATPPSVDRAHVVQVGIGFIVGWRETGATTSVVGRSVVCL